MPLRPQSQLNNAQASVKSLQWTTVESTGERFHVTDKPVVPRATCSMDLSELMEEITLSDVSHSPIALQILEDCLCHHLPDGWLHQVQDWILSHQTPHHLLEARFRQDDPRSPLWPHLQAHDLDHQREE